MVKSCDICWSHVNVVIDHVSLFVGSCEPTGRSCEPLSHECIHMTQVTCCALALMELTDWHDVLEVVPPAEGDWRLLEATAGALPHHPG